MTDERELFPTGRFEWERIVRRIRMPLSVKGIAFVLASYGQADGTRIRPGRQRLANVCDVTPRSITRSLVQLRELGLIDRISMGSNSGRGKRTDEYRLTIPSDLIDAMPMLGPDEGEEGSENLWINPDQVTPVSLRRTGTGDTPRHEQVTPEADQVTPVTGTGDTSVHLPQQDQTISTTTTPTRLESKETSRDAEHPVDSLLAAVLSADVWAKCAASKGLEIAEPDAKVIPFRKRESR